MEGWKIKIENLKGPDRTKWPWLTDEIYISPDESIACLVYSIAETSMGWYTGKLAIFKNKTDPKQLFDTSSINCDGTSDHVVYFDNGQKIGIRTSVYDKRSNTIYTPFLIVDLVERQFSFIQIAHGCHDTLEAINGDTLKLVSELKWYKLGDVSKYNKMIIKEGKKSKGTFHGNTHRRQ